MVGTIQSNSSMDSEKTGKRTAYASGASQGSIQEKDNHDPKFKSGRRNIKNLRGSHVINASKDEVTVNFSHPNQSTQNVVEADEKEYIPPSANQPFY